ncbi:MAG: hypothetical protein WDO16_07580 [Bacteroidota bacterium]
MTLAEIESITGKATSIDFNAPQHTILLIYDTDSDTTESLFSLMNYFPPSRELTIHVQYRYDERIDLSIIAKDNLDTVKINGLKYANGKQTYIHMNTLVDFAAIKYKESDKILFWTATAISGGKYTFPYMEKIKSERKFGLNIIGITSEFIEEK